MSDGAVTISVERFKELMAAEERLGIVAGEPCDWNEDEDGNWETGCATIWIAAQPAKFCGNCGRPIQARPGEIEGQPNADSRD